MASQFRSGLLCFGALWLLVLLPGILTGKQEKNDSASETPQQPPQPPVLDCKAFPGSPEWNECLADFQAKMAQFQQQVQAYAQQQAAQSGQAEGGATGSFTSASIYSNGYKIRTNGMSVSTNNVNGQIYIDGYIGEPDKVEVTKSEDTLKFEIVHDGKVTQWLTITPPSSASVDDIQYETKDGKLRIWAV